MSPKTIDTKKILYLSAMLLGLSFWGAQSNDPDLGWHLLGGQWILNHGHVPRADFINAFNAQWVDYHWLAQVVFYLLFTLGGFKLLSCFIGLVGAYLSVVILDCVYLIKGKRTNAVAAAGVLLFSWAILFKVTGLRPQAISLLFVALTIRQLLQHPSRYELPALIALTVLCVNIHVYWILIPSLWIALRVVPSVLRRKFSIQYSWLGAAILILCGYASPYGAQNFALLFDYAFSSGGLQSYINEFKSSLSVAGYLPWLFLLYVSLVSHQATLVRFRAKLPLFLLALSAFLLAVRTLKFAGVFALCGMPLLSFAISLRVVRCIPERFALAALFLFALTLSCLNCPWVKDPAAGLQSIHPIDACAFIARAPIAKSPSHDSLRVLTHFNFGGWCRWSMYNTAPTLNARVTTDGRTQFVPPEHYKLSFELYKLQYQWRDTLKRWEPDAVVVEKPFALAQYLVTDMLAWRLEYQDEQFAVFVPSIHSAPSASSN